MGDWSVKILPGIENGLEVLDSNPWIIKSPTCDLTNLLALSNLSCERKPIDKKVDPFDWNLDYLFLLTVGANFNFQILDTSSPSNIS